MSDQDARRWLRPESPLDARLGELLEAGRAERPSAAQLDALAKRLGPTFGGPGPGGGGGSAAPPSWSAALVAAAAILAMTGLWALFGGHAREKAAPASHPVTPQVVLASAAPSASARAKEPSAEAPPSDAGLRKAVKPVATAPRPSTRVSARNARDELALLEQAQLALREAPNRALAATDLHAQRFPQSQYAQERELLAIDALTRLNDRERARAGAERFLARYPGSPHVRRVRELLASIVTTSTPVDRGAR